MKTINYFIILVESFRVNPYQGKGKLHKRKEVISIPDVHPNKHLKNKKIGDVVTVLGIWDHDNGGFYDLEKTGEIKEVISW